MNPPFWNISDVDRKPIIYTNQTKRVHRGVDSFLPSGAVEYHPGPDPNWRSNGRSTMSGNGSSSSSGTVLVTGNSDDRYEGRATTPFGTSYGTPVLCPHPFHHSGRTDGDPLLPPPMSASIPALDPHYVAEVTAITRGSISGTSKRPDLLSPFTPLYRTSTSTVAPSELAAGVRPLALPPPVSGNAATSCNCVTCSDSTSAKCLQCQSDRQYELMSKFWDDERTHLEQSRQRMESICQEERRFTVDYYRGLWDAEKTQLEKNIEYLNEQVRRLGDENLLLRSKLADQAQDNQPIIHQGSFQGNAPLVDGSPPSPVASRQSGDAAPRAHSIQDYYRWPVGLPGCYPGLFGLDPYQFPTFRSPSPPGTSAPPPGTSASLPASAPPSFPSTRISISPQPGQETIPISPIFSPYSSSPSPQLQTGSPSAGVSAPARSPKRPLSVIDVHELDPKLEGISLRASAVRKTTFEEASSDGSPPTKRQRSLSHDYYIVTNLKEEDEETDVKKTEEDEDEERRLTMYAGYTPNHSPSLPPATTSGPSQGSATPTASSVNHESDDCLKREVRSATAAVTEETSESSRLSYPGLSNQLRRVESSSSDSCSQGVLSAASGDAPLKGPLMIKNIPAQDELFLAALNEKLEPISQGQDALPRAVQTPVAMTASLSAVRGGPFGDADAKQTAAPDNTDVSGTQSEVDDEHDGVPVNMEGSYSNPFVLDDEEQEEEVQIKSEQPAVRIKWPDDPTFGYDGTAIKSEPANPEFFHATDDEDLPVKTEASSKIPIKREDSDDDSDARSSEPEVTMKFKSTSNFGAPFGRM